MKIEKWACIWLTEYKKPNVKLNTYIDSYERPVMRYILPHFSGLELSDVRPLDVIAFYNRLSLIYHATTLSKTKLCMQGIFESAIENGLCERNPCVTANKIVKSQLESEEKRTYTQNQVDDILDYSTSHRYGVYIRILLELGLRCSELCGLQWKDIDLDRKSISICRACVECNNQPLIAEPKNESSKRTLPLSSKLTYILGELKNEIKPCESDYLLSSQKIKGRPLTPTKFLGGRYKRFFIDYGTAEDYLTPHELRHTCGTLLYNKTHDIYAVSKYLGHSSIVITSKLYVHVDVEQLRNSLQVI